MKLDILVAEIGSTTTVVNGFTGINTKNPSFAGQGQAPTSISQGDVRIGLRQAISNLNPQGVEYTKILASSSAAGGLRMTVHGLVYDMTVRAGSEAALGAGANIHLSTAGVLHETDIEKLEGISPNLILLAGGTDYGERDTAIKNAELICSAKTNSPVIYCGNIQNQEAIKKIFAKAERQLYITENVYPRLDELNIEPVRRLIHRAFEEHITEAPGMKHVREMVKGKIMPTPGAVMECAQLLYKEIGDLLVIDVGGATTDIHSVSEGSEEIALIQISPEPKAKRTVEGDLGLYVNAKSLCETLGYEMLEDYKPIPESEEQIKLTETLCYHAASIALKRHAGRLRYTYGAGGRRTWAQGKDLTKLRALVATGGALTRLPGRRAIMEKLCNINEDASLLYPRPGNLAIYEDSQYIMASLGVLHGEHPEDAAILARSIENVSAINN